MGTIVIRTRYDEGTESAEVTTSGSDRERNITTGLFGLESYGSVNSQGRWACANILTTLTKSVTGLYLFRISPAIYLQVL